MSSLIQKYLLYHLTGYQRLVILYSSKGKGRLDVSHLFGVEV